MKNKMMFGLTAVLLTACEKVIEVPLNSADVLLVVEARLKEQPNESYVLISQSASVYEMQDFPKVSGATVTVTDKDQHVYVFEEQVYEPGKYECPGFQVQPHNKYALRIEVDGEIVTAVSETFSHPQLDSLTIINDDYGVSQYVGFDAHTVQFHATDNTAERNYYQSIIRINGKESTVAYIASDEQLDEAYFTGAFFGDLATSGDSVKIELLSIDEAYYDFLRSLSHTDNSSPMSAAPGNPISNLSATTKVLGYFAAITSESMSIKIPG